MVSSMFYTQYHQEFFREGVINIIGNGVVIDPIIFDNEIKSIIQNIFNISELLISKKAHLILPTHKLLDAASEKAKGKKENRINT